MKNQVTGRTRLESDGMLGRVYSYYVYEQGHERHLAYMHVFSPEAARNREALALRRALTKQGGSA